MLPYAAAISADKLVSCWSFDINGTDDYSDNDGILKGNAFINTTGYKIGTGCLQGDGDGDYINVTKISPFNFNREDSFTFMAWGLTDSALPASYMRIFFKANNSAPYTGLWMGVGTSEKTYMQFYKSGASGSIGRKTGEIYNNNKWHLYVFRYNGTSTSAGMDIIINNTARDISDANTGTFDNTMAVTGVTLKIGGDGEGWSTDWEGLIDEVAIFNRSITDDEILDWYNGGNGLACSNFLGADTTPPIITIIGINQSYNETYNRPVPFNVSLNEGGNCTSNNTYWHQYGNTSTLFYFNDTGAPDGFYTLNLNCSDASGNTAAKLARFYKDTASPTIAYSILNASSIINYGAISLNISCTDNLMLYSFRGNITKSGNPLWNFSVSGLAGKVFSNLTSIDTSAWQNTTYTLASVCCDAHTASLISKPEITSSSDALSFRFQDTSITVKSIGGLESKASSICNFDRCSFDFEYSEPTGIKRYILTANKEIRYLKYSPFTGHFIIDDAYWIDFMPLASASVEEIQPGTWEISSWDIPGEKISFSSVGALNCIGKTISFTLAKIPPDTAYNKNLISHTQWFNTDILDLTTTPGVLMFIFLVCMYFLLLLLAHFSRIPAMHIFPLLYGWFLCWIIAGLLSTVLALLMGCMVLLIGIAGIMALLL